jgi:hypothetical protein
MLAEIRKLVPRIAARAAEIEAVRRTHLVWPRRDRRGSTGDHYPVSDSLLGCRKIPGVTV